ncbi:MAG: hypothetical protein IJ366_01090 [Clostridia bacterium]|nr:hypothetical protein [Clostridia bacterium]
MLKEKYKDEIDIKIGFEIEYYPDEFNNMLKNAIDLGAEYLILGQHFLGIYEGRNYPNELFWRIVVKSQAPVTFGFDAHDPECAFDGESLKIAEQMVSNYKLNYIGKPEILSIKDILLPDLD